MKYFNRHIDSQLIAWKDSRRHKPYYYECNYQNIIIMILIIEINKSPEICKIEE